MFPCFCMTSVYWLTRISDRTRLQFIGVQSSHRHIPYRKLKTILLKETHLSFVTVCESTFLFSHPTAEPRKPDGVIPFQTVVLQNLQKTVSSFEHGVWRERYRHELNVHPMEAVRTSETSVDNQYIPEDNCEHHTRRRENLKSHTNYTSMSCLMSLTLSNTIKLNNYN
jgi:hypothetical protein